MALRKLPLVLLVAAAALLAAASPAGAATGILAAKPWHYWVSFVLVASVVGMFFMLGLGYVVRVIMAKYGIKVGPRRNAG